METEGNSLPSSSCPDGKKRRVSYYYDGRNANVDYGQDHVMIPRRVAMTHGLVASYGLLDHMRRLSTRPAAEEELGSILNVDYADLLRGLTVDRYDSDAAVRKNAMGRGINAITQEQPNHDNPVIDGVWEYCRRYAGGSLASARALSNGSCDIAINWSGGMHHACCDKASGFCFVNDIVLAIEELLKHFCRVLYLDIDVHHGDGVENYYKNSPRVMSVSFHRYGSRSSNSDDIFFPGTGSSQDVGEDDGKYSTLNVPMIAGMEDEGYHHLFKPIMQKVMEVFRPDAIVMQCGADSLAGDKLGDFNLSVMGHAACVSLLRSFNIPLLLLGGGGYTINHVASCWTYETAVAIGNEKEVPEDIPDHAYEHYYKDQDYKLIYDVVKRNDSRSKHKLMKVKNRALRSLKKLSDLNLQASPSVPFTADEIVYGEEILYEHQKRRREDDDPMERMHRLCGEADLRSFYSSHDRSPIVKYLQ